MAFSDSESSELNDENSKEKKRSNSSKKKKNPNNKLYKSINELKDDSDEIKKNTKIKENDSSNNQEAKNVTKIYRYITKILENFIEKNFSNCKFVNNALKTIYSHIKVYLSSLNESKKAKDKQNNKNDKNKSLLYEFKIDDLNQQIKDLKYEIELLNTNESNKLDIGSPKKFKIYNYLKKKNLKLENKTRLDEFKYLLYIKEQQKKINDLEKKLKLKVLENSKEVKESKLFPSINQFDLKEHVNPKSIPLTETILKNCISTKRNISKATNLKKDYFLTITNSESKTPFKMIKKEENTKRKRSKEGIYKSINVNLSEEKLKEKNKNKRNEPNEADSHFRMLKLNSEIIPNKDKKFFISHPNLTIAGIGQRLNKYNIGIPNKLFSFKFSKNIDKNAFYKFPSTLNEIFVELEKLRIHANGSDMNNK